MAVQQAAVAGSSRLDTGMQGSTAALGSAATAARALTQEFATTAAAQAKLASGPPIVPPAQLTGIQQLLAGLAQTQKQLVATADSIQLYYAALSTLVSTLEAGKAATAEQAAAMRELAQAAAQGSGFTQEQAAALEAYNQKLAAGVPLTQAELSSLTSLAQQYAQNNREVLGLASATEQLLTQNQNSIRMTQQTAAAWGVLTTQLREGATVTGLQKAALDELTQAAQQIAGISDADKASMVALNAAIREGATVTPQQAAELQRLNTVLQETAGAGQKTTTALQELTDQHQKAVGIIRENAQALQLLTEQLRAGSTVTKLQSDALRELAERAKEGNGFTKEQAARLAELSQHLQTGARVTREQAQEIRELTEQYGKANQSILGMNKATEEQEGVFGRMKVAALGAAVILKEIGERAYDFGKEVVEGSARLEVLNTVMTVTGKNAHINSVALQEQVEHIKRLGITTMEATDSVIKFVQAELDVEKASKLARVAQDLAVVSGQNSSDAFQTLTQAIQSQSVLMLRQFGIVTGLQQIYGEYAAQVHKTGKELDETDKKQAFLNKILEEGQKMAGTYEAAMGDVGKQFTSLKRFVEEAQGAIGDQLLPVMRVAVTTATEFLKWFTDAGESVHRFTAAIVAMVGILAPVGTVLAAAKFFEIGSVLSTMATGAGTVVKALLGLAPAAATAETAVGGVAGWLLKTTVATEEAATSSGGLAAAWTALTALVNPWVAGIALLTVGISLAMGAWIMFGKEARKSADIFREDIAKAKGEIDSFHEKLDDLAKKKFVLDTSGLNPQAAGSEGEVARRQLEDYAKTLAKVQEAVGEVTFAYDEQTHALVAHAEKTAEVLQAERDLAGFDEELVTQIASIKTEVKDAEAAYDGYRVQLGLSKLAQVDAAEALKELHRYLDEDKNAIRENTTVWEDLGTILKGMVLGLLHDLGNAFLFLIQLLPNLLSGLLELTAKLADLVFPKEWAEAIRVLAKAVGIDMRDALHRGASEAEHYMNVWDPKRADAMAGTTKKQIDYLNGQTKALQDLREGIKGTTDTTKALGDAQMAVYGGMDKVTKSKAQQEMIKAGARDLVEELETGYRKVTAAEVKASEAAIKLAGHEGQHALKLGDTVRMTAAEIDKVPKLIEEKTTAAKAAAAKMGKAMAEALDRALGEGKKDRIAFYGVSEALKAVSGDTDRYGDVVRRNTGEIEKWRLMSESSRKALGLTRSEMEALDHAADRLHQNKLDDLFDNWTRAADKAATALRGASLEIVQKLQLQYREDSNKLGQDLLQQRVRTDNDIYAADRDLYEKLTVSRMTEVDQAVYQEKRRMDDIRRNTEQERLLRDEAFKQERLQIDARMDAEARQLMMTRNRIQQESNARLEAFNLEQAMLLRNGKIRKEDYDDNLDLIHRMHSEQAANLTAIESDGLRQVEVERQKQHGLLQERVNAAHQDDAIRDASFQRQVKGSAELVRRIREQYDMLRQFGIALWRGLADAFTDNLTKTLSGAQTWAQGLKGIWNSLKETFFNFVDSMLKKWLQSGITQMIGAGPVGAKTGVGGLLQGLFSRGALGNLLGLGGAAGTAGALGAGTGIGALGGGLGATTMVGTGAGGVLVPVSTAASPGALAGMSAFGAGALAAGAGGFAGYAAGSRMGSRTSGAVVGAAVGVGSGAATGALIGMLGGPIGAGIGAIIGGIAGLIGGIIGGGKEARAVEKARDEYIKAKGGIQELGKAAEAAGMSVDKLLSTKKAKEFQAEVKKIENGIQVTTMQRQFVAIEGGMDKLVARARAAGIDISKALAPGKTAEETGKEIDLAKAKFDLIDKAGGLGNLRRQAQLLGFDLKAAFDTANIEDFNRQTAQLNALLEAQQRRLAALNAAFTGLGTRLKGEADTLTRAFKDIFPKDADLKDFFDKFQQARAKGFAGTAADFAATLKNLGNVEAPEPVPGAGGVGGGNLDKIKKTVADAQAAFNDLGLTAAATFAAVVRETGDWVGAMEQGGPVLDQLIAMQDQLGLHADGAIAQLLGFRRTIQANQDVATSLSGIAQILKGLQEGGALTADVFNAMGRDAGRQLQLLRDRHVSERDQALLMQPVLQQLYEAQKNFGFATDEATQKLIDMGIANGTVGDQFQSVQSKTLDILVLIAKTLGADVPAALDTMAQHGAAAGQVLGGAFQPVVSALKDVNQKFLDSFTLPPDQLAEVTAEIQRALREGVTGNFAPEWIQTVKDQIGTIGPVADKAFADLTAGGLTADQALAALGPSFQTVVDAIRASGVDVGGVLGMLVDKANGVQTSFDRIDLSKFSAGAQAQIQAVLTKVSGLAAQFTAGFTLPPDQMAEVTAEIQRALKAGVTGDFAPEFIQTIKDQLKTLGPAADAAFNQLSAAGLTTDQALSVLAPAFSNVVDAVRASGVNVSGVLAALVEKANAASGVLGGGADDARGRWDELHKHIKDIGPDAARTAGTLRDSFHDATDKIGAGFDDLGGRLNAFRGAAGTAAGDAESKLGGVEGAIGGVKARLSEAINRWREFKLAALDAGGAAEGAATGVAEGHSPTGIKQIIARLSEAIGASTAFRDKAVADLQQVEGAGSIASSAIGGLFGVGGGGVTGDALLSQLHLTKQTADDAKKATAAIGGEGQASLEQLIPVLRQLTEQIAALVALFSQMGSKVPSDIQTIEGSINGLLTPISNVKGGIGSLIGVLGGVKRGFTDMAATAVNSGRIAEGAATSVAEGHSPTGIKQILVRLDHVATMTRTVAGQFVATMGEMEQAAGHVALPNVSGQLQQIAASGLQAVQSLGAAQAAAAAAAQAEAAAQAATRKPEPPTPQAQAAEANVQKYLVLWQQLSAQLRSLMGTRVTPVNEAEVRAALTLKVLMDQLKQSISAAGGSAEAARTKLLDNWDKEQQRLADIEQRQVRLQQARAEANVRLRAATENEQAFTQRVQDSLGALQAAGPESSLQRVGGALDGVSDKIGGAIGRWRDFGVAAQDASRTAEDAATGVAEGHSPTGIKQIVARLREATELTRVFRETAMDSFQRVELGVGHLQAPVMPLPTPVLRPTADGVAPKVTGDVQNVTVQLHHTTEVQVNALDPANMEEAWREKIQPEYEKSMNHNTRQIAFKVQQASNRYRSRGS